MRHRHAFPLARVADNARHGHFVAHKRIGEDGRTIRKGGVGQSVAEGQERLVAVFQPVGRLAQRELRSTYGNLVDEHRMVSGAARILLVIVDRYLPFRLRESNRQSSRGSRLTHEESCQRRTCHRAAVETVQHGVSYLQLLPYAERTTRHDNQHHGLTRCLERTQLLGLIPGQVEVRTTACLARQDTLLTAEIKDDIGLLGLMAKATYLRLAHLLPRPRLGLCIRGHQTHFPLGGFLAERHQRGNGHRVHLVEAPCTILVMLAIRQRSADEKGERPRCALSDHFTVRCPTASLSD